MPRTTTSDSNSSFFSMRKTEIVGVYATALAFPAMTLSISATQILIGLSFACFFIVFLQERLSARDSRHGSGTFRSLLNRLRELPPVWLAGCGLFVWLFLSGLLHSCADAFFAASAGHSGSFMDGALAFADGMRRGAAGEWGDVALFLFGLLVYRHARRPEFQNALFGGLTAAFVLLILSGVAAAFSEFRLARAIPHFFRQLFEAAESDQLLASAANRPQHPFAVVGGWTVYRPIGFMNTRLTFAGLLMLTLPWAAGRTLLSRKRLVQLAWAAGVLAGGALLLINGTRSILLGAGVAGLLGLWLLLRTRGWRRRTLALAALVAGLSALSLVSFSDAVRLQSDRALARVQRHTDFARPILWTVAGELTAARPVLGVGPGNFERAGLEWREAFVREHPETLYFFRNTPRGHAHNDLLHLAATGGLPAALFFLALVLFTTRELFERAGDGRDAWLLLGAVGFFVAGIAQCYFQDDEVTTLYWALLGLATGTANSLQRQE